MESLTEVPNALGVSSFHYAPFVQNAATYFFQFQRSSFLRVFG
jgi:hypothetical protein